MNAVQRAARIARQGRTGRQELNRLFGVLVKETDDQIFYRHEFIRIWIDNFAPTSKLRVSSAVEFPLNPSP